MIAWCNNAVFFTLPRSPPFCDEKLTDMEDRADASIETKRGMCDGARAMHFKQSDLGKTTKKTPQKEKKMKKGSLED